MQVIYLECEARKWPEGVGRREAGKGRQSTKGMLSSCGQLEELAGNIEHALQSSFSKRRQGVWGILVLFQSMVSVVPYA